MSIKLTLSALSLLALFGCATPSPPVGATPGTVPAGPPTGVCNAQGAQFALGKQPLASLVEQARQRSGSYMARVLRPGQVVTMEFNAQRLNLDLDAAGVIIRARCG